MIFFPQIDSFVFPDCQKRPGYNYYITGGCDKRNELGPLSTTLEDCSKRCTQDSRCISFEYRKSDDRCQLSTSCIHDLTAKDYDFCFYEKNGNW